MARLSAHALQCAALVAQDPTAQLAPMFRRALETPAGLEAQAELRAKQIARQREGYLRLARDLRHAIDAPEDFAVMMAAIEETEDGQQALADMQQRAEELTHD